MWNLIDMQDDHTVRAGEVTQPVDSSLATSLITPDVNFALGIAVAL